MTASETVGNGWTLAPVDDAVVAEYATTLGVSHTTARVLAARGLGSVEEVRAFLEPSLARDWVDPEVLPGMPAAADRVAAAIRADEHIVVFGDFDLDGVSAAAVAVRGLRACGARAEAMVPRRFDEGYGLTPAAIERALSLAPDLIVTVDCGVSGAREVAYLLERGVDVVVTDHHEPGDGLPRGVPVANPKLEVSGPGRALAGAGVALALVQAVGRRVGHEDAWRGLVDLATLGTIADVVPLMAENRALVVAGLDAIRHGARTGVAELCAVAGVDAAAVTSEQVAFALAPRLNAAGRMADPAVALTLLTTDDPREAHAAALALDEHNRLRQAVEADLAAAASALADRTYRGERALVLAGEGWHEGVKGIVASRLAARYRVPVILLSIEDGVARGSGRSVGRIDLFEAVRSCDDLLERFGGHAAAIGLTIAEDRIDAFREALLARLEQEPEESFHTATVVDALISLDEASVELGAELAVLEPFGSGNRKPLLAVSGVFMNGRQPVGRSAEHLKFTAYDGVAGVPAIAFRCPDIERLQDEEAPVDVAFELAVDEWRGRRRAQLLVRDIHVHERSESPGGFVGELLDDLFARADEIVAREEYFGIEEAAAFHTKIVGVTFEDRQSAIAALRPGTPLRFEREPENPYDANAIAVREPRGSQVGYLNRRLAAVLAPVIDAGVEYDIEIADVTGGEDERAFGVNVLVSRRDADCTAVDDEEVRLARRAELTSLSEAGLLRSLTSAFIGDRELHAAQGEALDALAAGASTLCVMATGRGKSLIFHLHAARVALAQGRASVFVYPLRALVADQAFHLSESFASVGLRVAVVTGESSETARDEAFSALADGSLDTILTTPEFLHFHADRFARSGRVGFVVVDEAHHVGLARAGNRPAYARLGDALTALGHPVVLAVTATACDEVAERIRTTLGIERLVLDPTVRENLAIGDRRGRDDKDAYVCELAARGGKMVVYVNSRDASVRIARLIRKRVPEAAWQSAFYNGGLTRSVRHAVERAFRSGEVRVVIATSAFGEGVNIPDIRNVVLYHLPFSDVEFNQMAGRAGRDGAHAQVDLLFGDKDARINERILSTLAPSRDDLATLYRVLRERAARDGDGFEATNAELAAACGARERGCGLDERGVSSAIGVFRELGLVRGEGHGAYRRLTVVPDPPRMDLANSVRYAEGLDEIEQFARFREWALTAAPDELLQRFNRPILPTHL